MNNNCIVFNDGVKNDRVFAHRGDVFICEGLFKNPKEIDPTDHVLGKENRPVLVISDDIYNSYIVKVLPLSTKAGNPNSDVSCDRCIKFPPFQDNPNTPNYIDISQIFTINQYQLKIKIATVSQEIVDTAVALSLFHNMNSKSVNTIVKFIQEKYPYASIFKSTISDSVDNTRNPNQQLYSKCQRVSLEELDNDRLERENKFKKLFDSVQSLNDAKKYFEEWKLLGTDTFMYTYGLTHQQYHTFRNICITKMLGKVNNFNRFDWNS